MKDWENATLEYKRTAGAPLQEVLVAVSITRSPMEVPTYLHVQVWGGNREIEPCATVAL